MSESYSSLACLAVGGGCAAIVSKLLKSPSVTWLHTGAAALTLSFSGAMLVAIRAGSSAQTMSKDFPLSFRLAAQFRTPLLMFFVLPLSFVSRLQIQLRNWFRSLTSASDITPEAHCRRVENIQEQIRSWNIGGRKKKLRTARSNWQAMSTKLSSNKGNEEKIQMPKMYHILHVDEENMTVTAEPGVTMGELTHYLVPRGYALLIQVEMESITLGGVSMGFGMETNSHVVGFFQESIVAFEIVTSEGDKLLVTKDSNPDLFYALPWSCGSIGFLTAVTVKITKVCHMYDSSNTCTPLHTLRSI
ncbi:unnamed protein product [Symbiodinium microadriaticum]|nr:unnamed protein product [Symbiodinium microadriaticum]